MVDWVDTGQLLQVFRAVTLAAFADGEPSAAELTVLKELLANYPAAAARTDAVRLVRETYAYVKQHGADALLDELVVGLPGREYQELAYVLVSRVVAADGKTAAGEAYLQNELQKRFGFTPADVLRLLSE